MKNLGKIILLFIMTFPVYADVNLSVDNDTVTRGERVLVTLSISGQGKVKIPPFDELCGYSIEGRQERRNETYNNGKYVQELSLIYSILPQKSCVIESFPVSVNDVKFETKPINITVSKMTIKKNDPFVAVINTPKKSVYVGEPFEMTMELKQRRNVPVLKDAISLPESKNLWVKSQNKPKVYSDAQYKIKESTFAMSAQQSGKLSLGPLRWDLKVRSRTRDSWGMFLNTAKVSTVFSNEVNIEVKELPEGVNLVGDLSISAEVDKAEINAGEAVNITISVQGRANIEDIQAFTFHLEDAQAFNEEPKVKHYLESGKYFGTFIQKSAIVAQRAFTIPSFELTYMDTKTDTVKTIKTEPIQIKVLNPIAKEKEELKVSRPKDDVSKVDAKKSLDTLQMVFLVLGGFILGLIVSLLPIKSLFSREKTKQNISAKESKETLQLLMSNMSNDNEIERLVKDLSENLYEGKLNPIDKKRLKEIVKRLQK